MKNEKLYRVALVGCGAVSKLYYTPALRELELKKFVQVQTLFDPDPKNTTEIKKSFPLARAVQSIDHLTSEEVDIAIIASPPQFHSQQAIQFLNSGIVVLCEKPMAASVSEAELMIETASSVNKLLAVGHFRRFFPATKVIQRIISLNLLGDITSFYFSEGGIFKWPVQSAAYFKKSVARGGVLLDIGVHLIDLMIWWFGYPTDITYEDDAMGGIEVNCHLRFVFEKGFPGDVRLSRDCVLPNQYRIHGTKGWLTWNVNDAPDKIQMSFKDSSFILDASIMEPDSLDRFIPGQTGYNFQQSFISQILNLIGSIEGRATVRVPGSEGIKSLRVIEHCYQNRKLMAMPWFNQQELEKAFQLNSQK